MDFFRLSNGVRVVLVPMPGVESVAIGTFVGAGSRNETNDQAGISHFIEHLAFKGTTKYPTQLHTSYLEGLGAVQNAVTSLDYTSYFCKIPADKWAEGFDVVADLTLAPLFPEAEIQPEKKVIIEEIKWSEDHPDDLIGDVLQRCLYGTHPLGHQVAGTAETVTGLTREKLLEYHQDQYSAGNLVVAVAGKIPDVHKLKLAIEDRFGSLVAKAAPTPQGFQDLQSLPRVEVEIKPQLNQTFIALAVRGLAVDSPKRFALGVLNAYLGRGATSRFYQEIREKRGLCYSISSGDSRLRDTGYWGVFAGLNSQKLSEAVEAILEEMHKVKTNLIPEEE